MRRLRRDAPTSSAPAAAPWLQRDINGQRRSAISGAPPNIRRDHLLVRCSHVELKVDQAAVFVKKTNRRRCPDADQSILAAGRVRNAFYLFTADRTIDHHMADMDTVTCIFLPSPAPMYEAQPWTN